MIFSRERIQKTSICVKSVEYKTCTSILRSAYETYSLQCCVCRKNAMVNVVKMDRVVDYESSRAQVHNSFTVMCMFVWERYCKQQILQNWMDVEKSQSSLITIRP